MAQRALTDLIRRKQERWAAGQKKRVALLLRVSDKKQAKDDQDVPIPVQRDYCLKLVDKHPDEWEIATQNGEPIEYTEAGVSAFKLSKDDRELLATAMADAAADQFDILVIYKTDRLSRNSEEYPIIIRQFAQMGVEIWVYETGTPLKSSTQVDKLLRFVEGWQAETESVNTRVRVTNAMKRMAENGAWTGGKTAYGFRLKDYAAVDHVDATGKVKKRPVRGIEVEPEEAKWVQLMFDLYVNQGLGGTQIARLINNPPYLARKRNGQPWDGPQILEILKNPIYMGRPAWGKNSYQTGRRTRKTADEWVWSEVHLPEWEIVDEATWHKAQKLRGERFGEVMKGKKMPPRAFTSHLLLTGTAYCGHCGQPLVTKTYSNKRTKADGTVVHDKYEGYICRNHKRGAKSQCNGTKGYWKKDLIEEAVLNLVDQWFGQFDFEQVQAKVAEAYKENAGQVASSLEAAKEEYDSLVARRAYYTDQLNLAITGKQTRIPLSVIEDQLSQIEAELETAEANLAQLSQSRSARMVEEDTLHQLSEILPQWASAFRQAPAHQRKFLLNQVVEKVLVYDETMEVAVNVRIKAIVDAASAAENETASTLEGAFTRDQLHVHQGKYRRPATHEDAHTPDQLQELFRFGLKSALEEEKRPVPSESYWVRVREVEEEHGLPFGEVVHDLRLKCDPAEIPGRLGVSRHFLYEHFGWAMDKIAFVERQYGAPLGAVVAQRRDEGVSMADMAAEWGLAVTTLYNALRRAPASVPLSREYGSAADRTAER